MSFEELPSGHRLSAVAVRVRHLAVRFWPAALQVDQKERWRALLGAGFGICLTALVSRWLTDPALTTTWLVAPMGASAVLLFAAPASPMAQPWSIVGGNTVSALAGITCASLVGDPVWAASLGVAMAIALMFLLRCLHPPGGASALLCVLLHATSYRFAVFPVLVNSVLLVVVGMVYNNLTGRTYPHSQRVPASPPAPTNRFSAQDLDAALTHYNQVLDVSRDDLEELLHYAELAAYQRNLGELRCLDIMTPEPVAVQFGTALGEAWSLMRERHIKALPVIDRSRRIVGIVTAADFLRQVDLDDHSGVGVRLRSFLQRNGASHSDKPEVVGQIMTRKVQVASAHRHAIELIALFSKKGHKHIPVMDDENRLVGVVTQSDVVRALYRAVKPEGG